MATSTTVPAAQPYDADMAVPTEPIWRLSVEQYHQMARAGILMDGDPVELLEGLLVQKMTKSPAHSAITQRVRKILEGILRTGWCVRSQDPITTEDSEPEPDVSVARGSDDDFLHRHPEPAEVPLVVEVADSTLRRDRTTKRRIYAAAGISAYWIVNLIDRRVEVFTAPGPGAREPDYAQEQSFAPGDAVPLVIEGREVARIPAADLLP